jgi:hypothetical protein
MVEEVMKVDIEMIDTMVEKGETGKTNITMEEEEEEEEQEEEEEEEQKEE